MQIAIDIVGFVVAALIFSFGLGLVLFGWMEGERFVRFVGVVLLVMAIAMGAA